MATGAQRRARKRAATRMADEVARMHALRAMAEKDTPRESSNDALPNRSRTVSFAKRRMIDELSMHCTVSGDSIYKNFRCSDLPRTRIG